MKYFLLIPFILFTIPLFGQQLDFENKVLQLMSEDDYAEAEAVCERAINNQRHGQMPYFMLAEVYLNSIRNCSRSKAGEYYLAMLAFDVYKRGLNYLGKHDREIFNKICNALPDDEWGNEQSLTSRDQVIEICFDKTTPVYFKSDCEEMRNR